jgi:hypothetical protein
MSANAKFKHNKQVEFVRNFFDIKIDEMTNELPIEPTTNPMSDMLV